MIWGILGIKTIGKLQRKASKRLGFKIDKLTSSIENKLTDETFETEILRIGKRDFTLLGKSNWQFDWNAEKSEPDREIYKLVTKENPNVIHGLISIEDFGDHIYLHLLESAPFNVGKLKMYEGVPGNLVAFACKISFEKGYNGAVAFLAKTRLVDHYENKLNAKRLSGNRMFIDSSDAYTLVRTYFKDFDNAQK